MKPPFSESELKHNASYLTPRNTIRAMFYVHGDARIVYQKGRVGKKEWVDIHANGEHVTCLVIPCKSKTLYVQASCQVVIDFITKDGYVRAAALQQESDVE